ncbi:D-hexose-6-phosphate mutarotase [Rugamonas sp.]|uniref:D-hexose-6-phosphate mutarotase n=1 Tax=Rugamonas sp. TaxID=1926287 RepID=UPI0025F16FA9|nr:D-hexose-6-phosphate mutarotase [Rugamonas sp.]
MAATESPISMIQVGQLAAVRISAADGAQATVALFGAHLLSWKTADGRERIFCSARSALDGSKAIRGGMPVIFPQFNQRGDGPRHGFARLSTWRLIGDGIGSDGAYAEFGLAPGDVPAALAQAWPHIFQLRLRFTLQGGQLDIEFNVRNSGTAPFPFGVALHTYYDVGQLDAARVDGLQRMRYTDPAPASAVQDAAALTFTEKLDRIYQAPAELTLHTADAALRLQQQGYNEWVVWNPGAEDAAALADLEDDEYLRFVCIEPARVDQQLLDAGAEWTGRHSIRC